MLQSIYEQFLTNWNALPEALHVNRRILIVYPHNFISDKSGIDSRYSELIEYFASRNFSIHLLGLKNFKSSWEKISDLKEKHIDELFLYNFKKGSRFQRPRNRKSNPVVWLKKKFSAGYAYTHLPDFAYKSMKTLFDSLISRYAYDFILISYVYWANLVRSISGKKSIPVLDLSDFITLNRFDSSEGNVAIGSMIEEEIRRVNLFKHVLCISDEEKYFFSQFARDPQFHFIPFFMTLPDKTGIPESSKKEPLYDILFTGSDNPHNKAGLSWFFESVYPRLNPSLRILVAGSATTFVGKYENVTCLPSYDTIEDIYSVSKIAICPLLGGTGMKIKIVEALSFAIPVITTSKGVTGFPQKTDNGCVVTDNPEEFANAIHLLLNDKHSYELYSKKAMDYFEKNFEKSVIYKRLDAVFKDQT